MSNAKTSQGADCEPSSRSPSAIPQASSDGATATPSALSIRSSTPSSSAQAANSGTSPPASTPTENGTLAERIAAPEYLDRIGGVAERIASASGQAAVQSLLSEGMTALGAENAIFVSFMRENLRVSSCRFMLACDPAWCRQYLDAGLIASDPWLAYASHHSEPVVASSLKVLEPERLSAIELATRNGFASGVARGWLRALRAEADVLHRLAQQGPPRASASFARTQPEGDVPASRARSTSAAFRPCRSTLSRSRDEGATPDLLTCHACQTTAPPRLSLHSPTHSVLARIEASRPTLPKPESSRAGRSEGRVSIGLTSRKANRGQAFVPAARPGEDGRPAPGRCCQSD